jgi:hypothetical protein
VVSIRRSERAVHIPLELSPLSSPDRPLPPPFRPCQSQCLSPQTAQSHTTSPAQHHPVQGWLATFSNRNGAPTVPTGGPHQSRIVALHFARILPASSVCCPFSLLPANIRRTFQPPFPSPFRFHRPARGVTAANPERLPPRLCDRLVAASGEEGIARRMLLDMPPPSWLLLPQLAPLGPLPP